MFNVSDGSFGWGRFWICVRAFLSEDVVDKGPAFCHMIFWSFLIVAIDVLELSSVKALEDGVVGAFVGFSIFGKNCFLGRGVIVACFAMTIASRSEFDARRFAPCSPVWVDSPTAYRFFMLVWALRLVWIPPHR